MERVLQQFFDPEVFRAALPLVLEGFRTNISLSIIAEICVLAWALVLALLRGTRGRASAPLRWLAVGYIDLFRGLPALVVIILIGFGMPQTGLPPFDRLSLYQLAVVALTLVYGAYVAEVYRAGIESIHPSQVAASRSLGLSGAKTMRFVVLPQAVRRVVPPLLNDFIGLQKDTSLVAVIGVAEGLRRAQILAGSVFNATPYVVIALYFVIVTIPLARLTDLLLRREQRRVSATS
jgi:polar amino acid transport system permease protein